jgi:hypothetical protein
MSKHDDTKEVICPCCGEEQSLEDIPENMIVAFACISCEEPLIVIQEITLKLDKKVLETGDIRKLQEYVIDILEEKFDISPDNTNLSITKTPELGGESTSSPISKIDISHMKQFLESYKVPRNGHMFE